jgi:hypothetical protein
MNGTPVWLASASLRDRHGALLPSSAWIDDRREYDRVVKALRRTLVDVGDPTRQRLFRMPVTVCLHRALTASEVASLPDEWHAVPPVHLAGGGLEVLWETEPGALSTRPCERPTRRALYATRPDLYTIEDCGGCGPCRARAESEPS